MAKAIKKKTAPARVAKKKTAPVKATKKTTEAVLQHHVRALMARKLDELMKDYCEESIVCAPMGTAKGLKEIREGFAQVLKEMMTPETMANMKTIKQDINGDYAYVLWSALPAVPLGGDTFHVHNGIIMMQTFVGQTNP
jgi:ketosteroid isomerase-like protein